MKISDLKNRFSCRTIIHASLGFLVCGTLLSAAESQFQTFPSYGDVGYDQPYRPKFHFTSLKNWINDPNGLTYYAGEYHLFFQHNPLGTGWGNMTWGHAVSPDMVHWKQLPHALLPYGNGYMFTGSGVVDENNSLGKQVGDTKTLAFIYSYALDSRKNFGVLPPPADTSYYQGLAYSTDKGRTFHLLNDGAPVIPFQGHDIDPKGTERDPKTFWHEPTKKWVTVLWLGESTGGRIRFFTSDDLQHWTAVGDLVRPWAHECMNLVELPVLDEAGTPLNQKKWVLADGGFNYEVGTFDGKEFKGEQPVRKAKLGDWNAAQTFNNSPDGRTVIIGWLPKAEFYKKKMPFTEQLTFPASMELRRIGNDYVLCRQPIKEIANLYTNSWSLSKDLPLGEANAKLAAITPECFDLLMDLEPKGTQELTMNIRGSLLTYNPTKNTLRFVSAENLEKKNISVGKTAEEIKKLRIEEYDMPDAARKGLIRLRILVDRGSVEIFLNDGITVLTHSVISDPANRSISFTGAEGVIKALEIHEVKSSWEQK